jgi:serine/threonine protein kinase
MDVLAGYLDAFVEAWETSAEPPDLRPFLPPDGEIRRLTLVELIKVDLEYRWINRNCPRRLADYLAEFPELGAGRVPCDLIYEEFHIRKLSGHNVTAEDYLREFPEQRSEVASILGIEQPYESSSFYQRRKQSRVVGISAGETIDDFDLITELGAGAFAKVFLARQKSMQRLVALKVSREQSVEPQTLAQLDHDHIVRVYDQRILSDRALRLLYMQYISGGTLQAVVDRVRQTAPEERGGGLLLDVVDETLEHRGETRPLETPLRAWLETASWPEAVCWIGAKLARALAYAHERGVLHRDVKPANVLISADPSPKLADFNISFSAKVAGATPEAYFGGSLAYMSPEQLEACNPVHPREPDELDGRSDFYSLGVVLWELLTGFRPFADNEISAGWTRSLDEMVRLRSQGVDTGALAALPGCPAGLPEAMRVTLQPDRDRRWSSGLEMARRLELCINPQARALVFPGESSLRTRLRRYTVLIVFVAAGLPNVLAGAFNYIHNVRQIPELDFSLFERTQGIINGIAYSVGALLFWYLGYSVFKGMQVCLAGSMTKPEERRALRRRCLRLGHLVALISVVEWSIAAYAYPMSLKIAGGELSRSSMIHFFFSLLLCGIVAASYPFFGVTFFSLRSLYPPLLLCDLEGAAADAPAFKQVRSWTWIYAASAALVPLLSIGALIGASQIPGLLSGDASLSMGVASAVGLFGLPIVFWLFHSIQTDLDTLTAIISDERRFVGR